MADAGTSPPCVSSTTAAFDDVATKDMMNVVVVRHVHACMHKAVPVHSLWWWMSRIFKRWSVRWISLYLSAPSLLRLVRPVSAGRHQLFSKKFEDACVCCVSSVHLCSTHFSDQGSPLFTSQVKYKNAEICLYTVFIRVENNKHRVICLMMVIYLFYFIY